MHLFGQSTDAQGLQCCLVCKLLQQHWLTFKARGEKASVGKMMDTVIERGTYQAFPMPTTTLNDTRPPQSLKRRAQQP